MLAVKIVSAYIGKIVGSHARNFYHGTVDFDFLETHFYNWSVTMNYQSRRNREDSKLEYQTVVNNFSKHSIQRHHIVSLLEMLEESCSNWRHKVMRGQLTISTNWTNVSSDWASPVLCFTFKLIKQGNLKSNVISIWFIASYDSSSFQHGCYFVSICVFLPWNHQGNVIRLRRWISSTKIELRKRL